MGWNDLTELATNKYENSRKKYVKLKFGIITIILLTLVSARLSCNLTGKDKMKMGDEIVNKIENFKKDKGKLPEKLSEIGIEEKEDSPIHYKKESETKYILWFGT
ncbi:MAG TPA: hypothetical protein VNI60_04870, partial [Pyrinomonadaceae bacterium]|nr:hypothetical protein [Pyrinomonadaceae bacterium]